VARIRIQRFEKELLKLISNTINFKLRDKHFEFVTITAVKLTNDMSFARIYFSHMNKYKDAEIQKALNKSSGAIKKAIADMKLMRKIPDLIFSYDKIEDNARKIDQIFEKIKSEKQDSTDPE